MRYNLSDIKLLERPVTKKKKKKEEEEEEDLSL
jgi:hypothetical protein